MRKTLKITAIPAIYLVLLCIVLLIGVVINGLVFNDSDVFWDIFTSFSQIICLLFVIPIYKKLYKWESHKTPIIKTINSGIFMSVILMSSGLYFALSSIIKYIGANFVQTGIANEPFEISDGLTILLHMIGSVIVAPIAEETCFRIIPLSISENKTEKRIVIVITSVMFAIIHGFNPLRIVELILISLLYSAVYLKTRNGVYLIVMHSVRNFITLILDTFAEHYLDFFLSKIAFIINGYVIYRPILVVFGLFMFVVGCYLFMANKCKFTH